MRRIIAAVVLTTFFLVVSQPAWSVIIKTKDGKVYRGHLIKRDPLQITFRLDKRTDKMTIDRKDLDEVIQLVEEERLRLLSPDNIQQYFNYAQELEVHKTDPEARDTALRLYLICAHADPGKFGYKALRRMSKLARNEHESRSFIAMAFLTDLLRDKGLLKKGTGDISDTSARENFVQALSFLRRGLVTSAKSYGNKKGVADYFDVIPGLMSHQEFNKLCDDSPICKCKTGRLFCKNCAGKNALIRRNCAACGGKGWTICEKCSGKPRRVNLTSLQVELILRLELLHTKSPKGSLAVPDSSKTNSWSLLLGPTQTRPVPVLSLRYLTEFDPRKNIYKKGKWVAPDK